MELPFFLLELFFLFVCLFLDFSSSFPPASIRRWRSADSTQLLRDRNLKSSSCQLDFLEANSRIGSLIFGSRLDLARGLWILSTSFLDPRASLVCSRIGYFFFFFFLAMILDLSIFSCLTGSIPW